MLGKGNLANLGDESFRMARRHEVSHVAMNAIIKRAPQ